MNILTFISEDFYFLSHRKDLLLGLRERGFNTVLVTNLGESRQLVEKTGIRTIHVNLQRRSMSPFILLWSAAKYIRILRNEQPGLVFAVALKPIVTLAIAQLFSRQRPALFAFAGLGGTFSGHTNNISLRLIRKAFEASFRFLLKRPYNYCLFQNEEDLNMFLARGWSSRERSFLIPGAGVRLSEFCKSPKPNEHVQFLFVGRLLWDKGIKYLVEACQILRKGRLPFSCRIAGLIDETNKSSVPVSYMNEQAGIGLIEWLGFRDDIPDLLSQADCFVFPSIYREGVPKVLLEASAAGLPMITTDMPGCRDVVQSGHNGILVPPKDSVKLAEAMERCICERAHLRIWGKNARQKAEREYGITHVIERHVEIFQTIARQHGLSVRKD